MDWDDVSDTLQLVGSFVIIVAFILTLGVGLYCIVGIPTAAKEARLYNEHFNTHYTTSDFFWAGDTIKSFLNKGEQKTINLEMEKK